MHACYVLHSRPFRNTSLLLEIFSEDQGRLPLVARGAKGPRSGGQGNLRPFIPLLADWRGKGEVKTLAGAEPSGPPADLAGTRLYCGLYLNELLMRLLPRDDPHGPLFGYYARTLRALSDGEELERELRLFEKYLLHELGYGLLLDRQADTGGSIEANQWYRYIPESGPVTARHDDQGFPRVHGATLRSLAADELRDPRSLAEARQLMRAILARYLGDRPVRSRELFRREASEKRQETS